MLRHIIEDLTMSSILSDRQYQTYKNFRFWSGMIAAAVIVIVMLALVSWNDDTLVKPKIENEFTKNNYTVSHLNENSKNKLQCVSNETGAIVTVGFYENGSIYDIGYAYPVEDAYMTDKNIRDFKNHISEAYKLVAKHKDKIKKPEIYPSYPISDECFKAYSKNVKKKSQISSTVDNYEFLYEYLGDKGDNGMFYYYTVIND